MSVKLPCHGHGCLAGKGQERGLHCEDKISCLLLCSAWTLVARCITGDAGPGKKTFGRTFHSPVFTKLSPASDISSRLKFSSQRQFSRQAVSVLGINSEVTELLEREEGLQHICQCRVCGARRWSEGTAEVEATIKVGEGAMLMWHLVKTSTCNPSSACPKPSRM